MRAGTCLSEILSSCKKPSKTTHCLPLCSFLLTTTTLAPRYFLFASCLIVLSNEFGAVYENPSYQDSMDSAIRIVTYCAEADPQAHRLLYILHSFQSAVADVRANHMDSPAMPAVATANREHKDPIASLFGTSRKGSFSAISPFISHGKTTTTQLASISTKAEHLSSGPLGAGGGARTSLTGVSPVSSAGARDPDTADGELDFDNLWNPWTMGTSMGPTMLAPGRTPSLNNPAIDPSHPSVPASVPPLGPHLPSVSVPTRDPALQDYTGYPPTVASTPASNRFATGPSASASSLYTPGRY